MKFIELKLNKGFYKRSLNLISLILMSTES